ncbi:MAG: bifunctional phosphoribosylaminoimidazolecarboxamide formyltransferase/IMP cyclohydrolase [Bacillota bacterium]
MITRALLSVSDKSGLIELAQGLSELGVELVSTGGTAKVIREAGLIVREVEDLTGFPEMMDGRVKTLHPKVHGGILARRDLAHHQDAMVQHGIEPIDLVVVNLYPFYQTISQPSVTHAEAIENIDIGGPAMIRSAAKNAAHVAVVVDPLDYGTILSELCGAGEISASTRTKLAVKAFRHTSHYDSLIAAYLGEEADSGLLSFPEQHTLGMNKVQELRYGENPHQVAALYRDPLVSGPSIVTARRLQGKELSFCNINDANAALETVMEFSDPAAVAVKHATPCGAATGMTLAEAYQRCYAADPVSIYGGIVALNRTVDGETAQALSSLFLDVILAPEFSSEALSLLGKKKNLRLLAVGDWSRMGSTPGYDLKRIRGGYLLQSSDQLDLDPGAWQVVTDVKPDSGAWADIQFAWTMVKHVKSNAIVIAKDRQTVGIGGGQTNRIDAARHAVLHAGSKARGSVLASDAFFPFDDVVREAAEAGIRIIIQPGGAVRDAEVVAAANDLGIAMIFTGRRHFKH